jgi:hypothetical protein
MSEIRSQEWKPVPERRRQPYLLIGRLFIYYIGALIAELKRQYTTLDKCKRCGMELAGNGKATHMVFHFVCGIAETVY